MTETMAMPPSIEPQNTNETAVRKPRPKWLVPTIAAGCAVAVLAAGLGGWTVWEHRTLAEAEASCADMAKTVKADAKKYEKLLKSDKVASAAKATSADVADAKTVDALAEAVAAKTPATISCPSDRAGLAEASEDLSDVQAWYATHTKSVNKAVKAVSASVLDKTVADANRTLKDSAGKVADEATRQALTKAIDARDAEAIAAAVKSVGDSVAAKTRADEEAKAQADAAAQAAQAQASASTGASSGGWSSSSTGGGWSAGSTGGSTSGGYVAPSQPSTTTGGGGASGGSTDSGPQWGLGCEVTESNPYCEWETVW